MKKENEKISKALAEVWELKDAAMKETEGLTLSDSILKRIRDSLETTKKLKLKLTSLKHHQNIQTTH